MTSTSASRELTRELPKSDIYPAVPYGGDQCYHQSLSMDSPSNTSMYSNSRLALASYSEYYPCRLQDSKKYADTTSFVVTAVTTNLVVTVLL